MIRKNSWSDRGWREILGKKAAYARALACKSTKDSTEQVCRVARLEKQAQTRLGKA